MYLSRSTQQFYWCQRLRIRILRRFVNPYDRERIDLRRVYGRAIIYSSGLPVLKICRRLREALTRAHMCCTQRKDRLRATRCGSEWKFTDCGLLWTYVEMHESKCSSDPSTTVRSTKHACSPHSPIVVIWNDRQGKPVRSWYYAHFYIAHTCYSVNPSMLNLLLFTGYICEIRVHFASDFCL